MELRGWTGKKGRKEERKEERTKGKQRDEGISMKTGLEINEKNPFSICDKIRKFSRNFANFSHKIAALRCVISGLAKKYEPAILVCKETAENGE